MNDKVLLSKKDIVERWDTSESTINRYISDGILVPVKNLPCVKFHIKHVMELEGVELTEVNPIYVKKVERENEALKYRVQELEKVLRDITIPLLGTLNKSIVNA